MKVFITGATGFIGSHILNLASHYENLEVIALRRNISSKPRISISKEPIWLTKQMENITKEDLVDVEVFLHLAAHSMFPPYDSIENCIHWNLTTPIKLFEHAHRAGVKKFIVTGSCFEYGLSGEYYDFIPTDAPLKPTNNYAASKAAASIIFNQFAIQNNLKLSYHRLFHVFGEGENEDRLWPTIKNSALNGEDIQLTEGEQIRDFINVLDVAQYLIDACLNDDLQNGKPRTYNVGSGNPMSIFDFTEHWWKIWEAKGKILKGRLPYRDNEVMRYVPKI